jgi:hypothetical protein
MDALIADPTLADEWGDAERDRVVVTLTALAATIAGRSVLRRSVAALPQQALLNVKQAAPRLGISPSTLYKRVQQEPYKSLRVFTGSDRVMFSPAKLARFVEEGGARDRAT